MSVISASVKAKRLASVVTIALAALVSSTGAWAGNNHHDSGLPPGLAKKAAAGQPLPPGWQKKLVVGHRLDRDIYRHGDVIVADDRGLVTVRIEGKLVRLVENTLEIVDILDTL
ncbi:hypothetical protein [Halioxenophilus sp. WMMB6]|uniref:hypothetical protein n=1 Tax=Halioxenophilus sp. WMMB6 TaxID=3073815 RepID=UPI00295F03AB|nr:hypothetical protein [Halioxenophilus sp. WMMB6]